MRRMLRIALWIAAFAAVLFLISSLGYSEGRPRPHGSGRSWKRCSMHHGEAFILCAEGWKPLHNKLHAIEGCEPHRPGSQFRGPYGLGTAARKLGGGCGREAALEYLQERYSGSWGKAEEHHRREDWW